MVESPHIFGGVYMFLQMTPVSEPKSRHIHHIILPVSSE